MTTRPGATGSKPGFAVVLMRRRAAQSGAHAALGVDRRPRDFNDLVPAGELERLEHLCRYVTRPPIATRRLAQAPDGRVVYGLKRHWRDGTSAVSFDPLAFIERLGALVPPPRSHKLTCQGMLAPSSAWRDLILPKRAPASTSPPCGPLASNSPTAPSTSARSRSSRSTWAELLRRVFAVDVLTCP
ncbi:MAG: transposase [Planctomycetes bacterium]|nr:transposase [Planctomycetota bacterium]